MEKNIIKNKVWVADKGDGTYSNPILFADYSDPDVIRVDNNFYMVASSFNCMPGLPILHSKDLVNWKIVNHVYDSFPLIDYNKPAHGKHAWAPSIRYHNNRYWVFVGDPDEGIYMSNTEDPGGKWSEPIFVKRGKGLIDTCPFWDDDGKAYLIHAYARSRAGFKNILNLCKMSPDGTTLLDEGEIIFDGEDGHPTTEGPKMYKRNGYYYIFAPAGGVSTGWQLILRSRNIYGPYEEKVVLKQGDTPVNGPHQGGYVELESGESWFIHFQDRGVYGRVTHLQPIKWINDWPIMGEDVDGDGIGEPVLSYKKPDVGKEYPVVVPGTSDDFFGDELSLQWQWHANPDKDWYSLEQKEDCLRLYTENLNLLEEPVLWYAPNLLLQKFPAPIFEATTELKFKAEESGERAGLIIMGEKYSYISLTKSEKQHRLSQYLGIDKDGIKELEITGKYIDSNQVFLRVTVNEGGLCRFSYSYDNKDYKGFGKRFQATAGRWIGAKVGLFAVNTSKKISNGYADYMWFNVKEL